MEIKDLAAEYGFDKNKSLGGAILQFDGFGLLVARWGNENFRKKFLELTSTPELRRRQSLRKPGEPLLTDEEDAEIMNEVLASTVLVGWYDITENGGPFPYCPQNARKLLELESLRDAVVEFSKNQANYRAIHIEDGVDALKKSSSGPSSTETAPTGSGS